MAENSDYDELTYPSYVFPQTSPHRLATMGTLYGMRPPDPRNCRYLDIGCGDGSNTLLHAHDLPGSSFLGIDLSGVQVDIAKRNKAELALSNVDFIQKDLMDFSPDEFGEFDYIVAHGFYSWVPEFVRERLEWIYKNCLADQGIGYVSYNTFPGCHVRAMVWDMIRYRTRNAATTDSKLRESAEFLFTFGKSYQHPQYKEIVSHEIATFAERRPEVIFHDDLSEINQPFYFHEFAARMGNAGLQFLHEMPSMAVSEVEFNKEENDALTAFGGDLIEQEQYKDYLRCQRFRSTIVCHSDVKLERKPAPAILDSFRFFSDAPPLSKAEQASSDSIFEFTALVGGSFTVEEPLTGAILQILSPIHPRSLSLEEAVAAGVDALGRMVVESESEKAKKELLKLVFDGLVQVQLFQPGFVSEPGEKPSANAFARWQAEHECESLTTLAGFNVQLSNPAVVELIRLLDGTRDRQALSREMIGRYEVPEIKRKDFEEEMPKMIDIHLRELAACGMLSA